jgi:hypothetical protein
VERNAEHPGVSVYVVLDSDLVVEEIEAVEVFVPYFEMPELCVLGS